MIARAPIDLDAALTSQRARRFTDPAYVRCPRNCDAARGCPHCCFRGVVLRDSPDATCTHLLERVASVGRCLTKHRCTKCGTVITIDSSD